MRLSRPRDGVLGLLDFLLDPSTNQGANGTLSKKEVVLLPERNRPVAHGGRRYISRGVAVAHGGWVSALSHLAPLWPPSEDDKNSSITSQQLHKAHLEYSTKWMWRERSEKILAHAGDSARAVWNPGRESLMYTSSSLREAKQPSIWAARVGFVKKSGATGGDGVGSKKGHSHTLPGGEPIVNLNISPLAAPYTLYGWKGVV